MEIHPRMEITSLCKSAARPRFTPARSCFSSQQLWGSLAPGQAGAEGPVCGEHVGRRQASRVPLTQAPRQAHTGQAPACTSDRPRRGRQLGVLAGRESRARRTGGEAGSPGARAAGGSRAET